jgi:NTE family protein
LECFHEAFFYEPEQESDRTIHHKITGSTEVACRKKHLRSSLLTQFMAIFFLLFCTSPVFTSEPEIEKINLTYSAPILPPKSLIPYRPLSRPRVGLALSGGGLRGIAQIGVIKALTEHEIPIDYIVGSSIGSVIGGLLACGYSPEQIWEICKSIEWDEILNDSPKRESQFLGEKQKRARYLFQFRLKGLKPHIPDALTPGQKLSEILTQIFLNAPYHSQDFSKLKIPLKIIATDLLSGDHVVIQHGDIAEAARASIAIPLLLSPVEKDSMILVDGGLLDNIPVLETILSGVDIVIAVNTTSLLRNKDEMDAPWKIADQVTTLMQKKNNEEQLELADVAINFDDLDIESSSSQYIDSLYAEGERRGLHKLEEIRQLLQKHSAAVNDSQTIWLDQIIFQGHDEFNLLKSEMLYKDVSRSDITAFLDKIYNQGSFTDVHAELKKNGDSYTLKVVAQPNPVLKKIVFYGNTVFPDSVLKSPFSQLLNKPINYDQSRKALEEIISLYRDHGYSLSEIYNISFFEGTGTCFIYIAEGKLSDIEFVGQKKTKDYVIAREFSLEKDHIFQFQKALTGQNNVYATGLFNSVSLEALPLADQKWKIRLRLKEKNSYVVRVGAHYNDERNGRVYLELADENIAGSGHDLTIHGQYGEQDIVGFVDLQADRIFKTYLTANINVHHNRGKYFAYKELRNIGEYEKRITGFDASIGQQIGRFGTLSASIRSENINIRSISGHGFDPGMLFINTIGASSIIDTRDQVPYTLSGKYHSFSYEVSSGKFLGADISFFKVKSQLSGFWTFRRRNTISSKIMWATSDLTTPFSEQFRIGGEATFYGLREGELLGRHLLLGSIEYRHLIPWNSFADFYLSFRFDGGAVWENAIEVATKDFINGKGVAIIFKLPIGPVSIAYGRASNGKDRVYLSAGYNF